LKKKEGPSYRDEAISQNSKPRMGKRLQDSRSSSLGGVDKSNSSRTTVPLFQSQDSFGDDSMSLSNIDASGKMGSFQRTLSDSLQGPTTRVSKWVSEGLERGTSVAKKHVAAPVKKTIHVMDHSAHQALRVIDASAKRASQTLDEVEETVLQKWPRTCSCLLGVFVPLLFLLGLCVLFGLAVARYEAPHEVAANDLKLMQKADTQRKLEIVHTATRLAPQACLEVFLLDKTQEEAKTHLVDLLVATVNGLDGRKKQLQAWAYAAIAVQEGSSNGTQRGQSLELLEWMSKCGDMINDIGQHSLGTIETAATHNEDPTFHWIRCIPGANGLDGLDRTSSINEYAFVPTLLNQTEYLTSVWNADQARLKELHAQELRDQGYSREESRIQSWPTSIGNATGEGACEINPAAAGWFWFTIMSTMGYGSQFPSTEEGKLLVYTLGFVSILAFGAVLGIAGLITAAIVDDLLVRIRRMHHRMTWITSPWASCLLWGILYYAWMMITAAVVMAWKHDRVRDLSFTFWDGYWFAYISSTTIGLGDINVDSPVIQGSDVIVFPFLFLVNFVFIAAFLAKLGDFFSSFVRTSMIERLVQQLKKTDAVTVNRPQKWLKKSKASRQLDIRLSCQSEDCPTLVPMTATAMGRSDWEV